MHNLRAAGQVLFGVISQRCQSGNFQTKLKTMILIQI